MGMKDHFYNKVETKKPSNKIEQLRRLRRENKITEEELQQSIKEIQQ